MRLVFQLKILLDQRFLQVFFEIYEYMFASTYTNKYLQVFEISTSTWNPAHCRVARESCTVCKLSSFLQETCGSVKLTFSKYKNTTSTSQVLHQNEQNRLFNREIFTYNVCLFRLFRKPLKNYFLLCIWSLVNSFTHNIFVFIFQPLPK